MAELVRMQPVFAFMKYHAVKHLCMPLQHFAIDTYMPVYSVWVGYAIPMVMHSCSPMMWSSRPLCLKRGATMTTAKSLTTSAQGTSLVVLGG